MSKRTSAEIINATLVEVFLAFLFVVLAIAWFHASKEKEAEDKGKRFKRAADTAAAKQHEAEQEMQKVLAASPYAPPCDTIARPRELVTLTLIMPDTVRVSVVRGAYGLVKGDAYSVTFGDFIGGFRSVVEFAIAKRCHEIARVMDTPQLSKEAYKHGLRTVREVFYTYGELR